MKHLQTVILKKCLLYIKYSLLLSFVCFYCALEAQIETRTSRAYGNVMNSLPSAFVQSADDKFIFGSSWISGFSNVSNYSMVELGLDEELHLLHGSPFKVCAKFDVQLTDASSNITTVTNQTLEIFYHPTEQTRYKDKAQLIFPNQYRIRIYNISLITCLDLNNNCSSPISTCTTPIVYEDVYIQAQVTTNRLYNFNVLSALAPLNFALNNPTPSDPDLTAAWDYLPGAQFYELEYTYVDNYSPSLSSPLPPTTLNYDLDHDATRIVTTENTYQLPLTYEQGYLVFRIRGVAYDNSGNRIEGAWAGAPSFGLISSVAANNKYLVGSLESDKFNWQATKTFAENGRAGTGVSYSDAVGLARQSSARLNTENKSIVQSSLYDHYARPAVNFLPTPISTKNFLYKYNLNMLNSSTVFDKNIFNICAVNAPCTNSILQLDPVSSLGATNYYSPSNFNAAAKKGYQDFLPDAEGVAYTWVKYQPNELNLIASQSMPGKTHAIGSNHELKYFYSKPSNVELQRLFGSEVGDAKNYYKNYVLDPNGQLSLSYIDMFGRTIATGIVGAKPAQLDNLSNTNSGVIITEQLGSFPNNVPNPSSRCKEVNSIFMVTAVGEQQTFTYETTLGTFMPACDASTCYDCAYDLEISIKDDCGTEVFKYNTANPPGLNIAIGATNTPYTNVCEPSPLSLFQLATSPIAITFTRIGTYTIYKKICVSDAPVNDYKNLYSQNANCMPSLCSVIDGMLANTNFAPCTPPTCASCTAQVIAAQSAATMQAASGGPRSDEVFLPVMTPQQLSAALQSCQIYCAPKTNCDKYAKLLEKDFYPGTGQYAATSLSDPNWGYSIFNNSNNLATGTAASFSSSKTWNSPPNAPYKDAAGNPDNVVVGGVTFAPNALSSADFQTYFKQSWAKALLPLHPEYCKYRFYCDVVGATSNYDDDLQAINHFDLACALGYVRPLAGTPLMYPPSCSNLLPDPVSSIGTTYPILATQVSNFITSINTNVLGSGKSIYKYVADDVYNGTPPPAHVFGSDPCYADAEWSKFKQIYKLLKNVLYQNMLTTYTNNLTSFGFTAGGCSAVPAGPGFSSNFPNIQDSISTYWNVTIDPANPPTSYAATSLLEPTILSYITSSPTSPSTLTLQYASNCSSYVNLWISNLTIACPAYTNASIATQNNIISALQGVCVTGCNPQNPMGASSSSAAPGYNIPSTSVYVTNFQQVLDHYLGSNACNAAILSMPAPYVSPSAPTAAANLTPCKCDQLLQIKTDFLAAQAASSLPAGVTYLWQYFNYIKGYDLADINMYLCACENEIGGFSNWNSTYPWTSPQTVNLANTGFQTPSAFTCKECITCVDVTNAINALLPGLPDTAPYPTVIDKIVQSAANSLYAVSVLNQSFGVHSLSFYTNLYEDCNTFNNPLTSHTFQHNLSSQALSLYHYLNSLAQNTYLTKNHQVKLCTDSKYLLSNLYSGPLPVIPTYNYNVSFSGSNSTVMNIVISTAAPATILSLQLSLPSTFTGGWSSINSLSDFFAYCPTPVSGSNYGFKLKATDATFNDYEVIGSVTNLAFPISSLANGGSGPVPAVCNTFTVATISNSCAVNLINSVLTQATFSYNTMVTAALSNFEENFKNHCFNSLNETFTRNYDINNESQYTLYYYDQAGNLQRTVPPKGVTILPITNELTAPAYPPHSLNSALSDNAVNKFYTSDYKYNTYNQPISENTVDGGKTIFFYDTIGRIMASQNAKQQMAVPQKYSYTLYDMLGRITEVGEMQLASPSAPLLTDADVEGLAAFNSFLASVTKTEITKTYYDQADPLTPSDVVNTFTGAVQNNLRNRVANVTFRETVSGPLNYGTYYSYDDHGNVTEIVQYNSSLSVFNSVAGGVQTTKHLMYEYDLISGNMLKAHYQKNKVDRLTHQYYYDQDNRLHEVFTTKDDINWERDAKYFYYEHGALARVERADKQVQGEDFMYTIHGWIKGINSHALNYNTDAGKDGALANSNYLSNYNQVHGFFARDAMAYGLNYYNTATDKDYKAINLASYNSSNNQNPISNQSNLNVAPFDLTSNSGNGPSLYNGNISSMITTYINKNSLVNLTKHPLNKPFHQIAAYRYDQLHRITKMTTFRDFDNGTNSFNAPTTGNYDDSYKMELTYDPNGNIKTLFRNGASNNIVPGSLLPMDNLTYNYFEGVASGGIIVSNNYNSNKLACVQDAVAGTNYNDDIDTYASCTESNTRYQYDEIGNLIKDKGEYILSIDWTVDRKVRRITRDAAAMLATGTGPSSVTKPDIEYQYNAMRQRVVKIVKPRNQTTKAIEPVHKWVYTYYIYDASGNVISVYNRNSSFVVGTENTYKDALSLGEHHIYGSNRLAINRTANPIEWSYNFVVCGGEISDCRTALSPVVIPAISSTTTGRYLGYKEFELTNHLGNVIATVSDRKIQLRQCAVIYEDFGDAIMNGVTATNAIIEIENNRLKVQPTQVNGGVNISYSTTPGIPYQMSFEIDLGTSALENGRLVDVFSYNSTTGDTTILSTTPINQNGVYTLTFTGQPLSNGGTKLFFRTNVNVANQQYFYLDNFKVVVATSLEGGDPIGLDPCSDGLSTFSGYFPDLLMHTDYYAFGMEMPGRKWAASNYRYSHNGQEKESELFAGANSAEYWMYDSRIGRRWELDPLSYEWQSPYAAFNNNPIYFADPLGLKGDPKTKKDGGNKTTKEKKEANMNKNAKEGQWKINDEGKPEYTKNESTKPTSAPTGNNQPNKGQEQHQNNTEKQSININLDKIANKWRAFDNSLAYLFKHVPDNDEWFKKGPPLKTTNGGFMPYGEGASKNISMLGNPENSISSDLPGATIYSSAKPNVWDFATIGKLPKHFEDFKKTIEQVEAYAEAGYGFIGFIVDKTKDKPAITSTNSDTVYRLVILKGGDYFWRKIIMENGEAKDSVGGITKKPTTNKSKILKKVYANW